MLRVSRFYLKDGGSIAERARATRAIVDHNWGKGANYSILMLSNYTWVEPSGALKLYMGKA